MCYAVHLSTDSPVDLAGRSSDRIRFERVAGPGVDPCVSLLAHPHRWRVESRAGCGCVFRHLHPSSIGLGFSEPVPWFQEEPDAIEATRELYRALEELLASGHRVDLIDRWEGSGPEGIATVEVLLEDVPERAFRLYEDHRFVFTRRPGRR